MAIVISLTSASGCTKPPSECPAEAGQQDTASERRKPQFVGYMRVSKADGSQTTDPQQDAFVEAGVDDERLYEDRASGRAMTLLVWLSA